VIPLEATIRLRRVAIRRPAQCATCRSIVIPTRGTIHKKICHSEQNAQREVEGPAVCIGQHETGCPILSRRLRKGGNHKAQSALVILMLNEMSGEICFSRHPPLNSEKQYNHRGIDTMRLLKSLPALVACLLFSSISFAQTPSAPIRVAIVGLEHGHIGGFLHEFPRQHEVELVGIVETDKALAARYQQQFHLDPGLFYSTLDEVVAAHHPQALLVYTSVGRHRQVIEQAAQHGISVMVEKPLTISLDDALAIRRAANVHHIQVLVNYETTWYASNRAVYDLINEGKLGDVRRVVVHDGHEGPAEIHVQPEFLKWLTDPALNGAGALYDFGCYGADLMTWWMHGKAPISVTAIAQTDKPETYARVDDDATIILQYPGAQAVLMPSWAWTFARKDSEIYGSKGYAITEKLDRLRVRYVGDKEEADIAAQPLAPPQDSSLHYLAAVLNGTLKPEGDLTSLDTNMIVMQILDAARESVRTGRTVKLKPLPPE
jgi:glucose-fructose oxidoreductase